MGKKNNKFDLALTDIALDEGYDPPSVVRLFKECTSADFLCGVPSSFSKRHQIPQRVWHRVCHRFSASTQAPYRLQNTEQCPTIFKEKAMVFIGGRLTVNLLADGLIWETFDTAKRLYQYLKWTLRISKVAGCMATFEGRYGAQIMVTSVELHDRCGRELYALCSVNDVVAPKAQRWQLGGLLTAADVTKLLGVDGQQLPRGVRASSSQFEQYRTLRANPTSDGLKTLKQDLRRIDAERKPLRYSHLKCIATGNGQRGRLQLADEKVLEVKLTAFHSAVRAAMESPANTLVPTVSIVSRKKRQIKTEDFSVDYLLPVLVDGNWVGVVFRGGEPVIALLDCYDITNKAILCDPSFDGHSMGFFRTSYHRLRVTVGDPATDSAAGSAVTASPATSLRSPSVSSFGSDSTVCAVEAVPAVPVLILVSEEDAIRMMIEYLSDLQSAGRRDLEFFGQFLPTTFAL